MPHIAHHEGLTLAAAKEYARLRVKYVLWGYPERVFPDGTVFNVDTIAATVVNTLDDVTAPTISKSLAGVARRQRRVKRHAKQRPAVTASDSYRNIDQNYAGIINAAIYELIDYYKGEWLTQCLNHDPEFALNQDVLAVWYVDFIVNIILDLEPSYVATAMLRLLFNYEYADLQRVVDSLDVRFLNPHDYRYRKKVIMDALKSWPHFGDLLAREDLARGEKQFETASKSNGDFELIEQCLCVVLPRIPLGVLSEKLDLRPEDVARILTAVACPQCSHAVEREKMHAMICPKCLRSILKALKLSDLPDRLRRPYFDIKGHGGTERPSPPGRGEVFDESEEQTRKFKQALGKDEQRRRDIALNFVTVKVGSDARCISLDQPTTLQIPLDVGQRFVKIDGEDERGPLTLAMRYIPWSSAVLDVESIPFVAKLKNGHKLNFVVEYSSDVTGELTGAVLNVHYFPPTSLTERLRSLTGNIRDRAREIVLTLAALPLYRRIAYSALILGGFILAGLLDSIPLRSRSVEFNSGAPPDNNSRLSKNVQPNADSELWRIVIQRWQSRASQSAIDSFLQDATVTVSDIKYQRTPYSIEVSDDKTIRLPRFNAGVYKFVIVKGSRSYIRLIKFPLEDSNAIQLWTLRLRSKGSFHSHAKSKHRNRGNKRRSNKMRHLKPSDLKDTGVQVVLVREKPSPVDPTPPTQTSPRTSSRTQ